MGTFMPDTFHRLVDHDPLQPRLVHPHGPDSGPIFSDAFGRLPGEAHNRRHPSARDRRIEVPPSWGDHSPGYRRRPHDSSQPSRRDHTNPASDSKKAETTKKDSVDPKQIQVTIHIHGTQNSAATSKMDGNKASKIREKVKNPSTNKEEVVKNVEQKPSGKPSDGVRIAHFKNPSHSILRKILDGRPIVIIRNNVATSEKNSKVTSSKTSPNQTQSTGDKVVKSKRIQSVSAVRSSSTKESIVNTNHLKHSRVSGDIKPSHNNAKAVDVAAAESQRRRALQHKAKTIPKDFASRIPGKTNQGTADFQNEHTNSIQKVTSKSSKENYHESQVKTVTSSQEKRVFGQNVQQGALFDGNSSAIEYSVLSDTQGSKYAKGNFVRQAKFSSKEETLKPNIHERGDTSSKKTKPLNTSTPDPVSTMYNVNTRDPKQDFRKVIDKQTAKHVSQLSTSVTAEGPSLYETQRVGNLYHAKNQNKDVKKKTMAIHDTSQQSQDVKPHAGVAHKSAAFQNENLVAAKETRQYLNSNPYPEQIQQQVKSVGQLQTGSAARTQANYDPVLLSLLAMMIQKDARRSDNQQGGQSKSKHNHVTQTNSEILPNVNNKELHIPVSVLEQLQLRGINVSGAGISPEGTGSGLQKSALKEEMQSRQSSQSRVLEPKYEANAFKTKIVLEVPKTSVVSKYDESIGTTRDFHALENPIKANTHNMKASTGNQATRESQSMNLSKSGSAALKKESQMDHQTGTTYPPLSHKTEIKGPVIHTKISVETHLIDPNPDTKHKNQQTHTPYEPAVDMNVFSAKNSLDTADKQHPAQGLISKVHTINSKQEFHSSQHQFPSRSLSRNLKGQAKNSAVEVRTKALIPETWLQSKTREEKHQTQIAYPQSAHETHYSSKKQHKTSGSKVSSSPYTSQIHEQYVSGSLINPLGSAKDQQASKTNYNTMTQQGKPGSIFSESGNNHELNIQQPMQAVPVVTATQRKTFKPAVPKLFSSQGHIQSMDGVQVGQSDFTAKQKMQPTQYTSQLLHDTSERGMNGQGSATTGHDQQASHISETNKYYVGEGQLHQKLSASGPNTQHFPPYLQKNKSKASHVGSHTLGSNTNLDIQQTQYSTGNPSHNLHGVSLHPTHQRQHNQLATYDSQIKQKIPESNQPTKKSSETFSQETSYALQSNSPLLQDYASKSNAMEKYGNGPSNPAMNVETNLQVTSYTFLSSDLNLQGHGTASKVTQAIAQNSNQPSVRDSTQPRDGTIKTIVSTSGSNRQVSDAKQGVEFSKHNSKMAKNNLTVIQSHISQDHMQGISGVKEHQTGTSRMQSKEPTHYSRQVQHDTSGSRHDQQASYISQTSDAYLGVGLSHHKVSAADPKTQHSISHSQANPERVNVAHQTSDMIKVIQKSSGSLGTQSHDLSSRALHQVLTSEASPNTQHSNMQANPDTLHAVRHTEGSNIGQSVQRLLSSSGGINRDLGGSSVHQLPNQKQIQMAAYFQTHQKAHTPNQHVPSHPKDSFHKSLPGFSGSQDQITVYTERQNDGQKSSLLTKSLATNHHDTSSNSLFNNLSSQKQSIESQGTLIVGQKSNQAVKHVTTHPKVMSHSLHSNVPNSLRHSVLSKESHYIEKMSNQPMSASTHPQDASFVSFSNNPDFRGHATVSKSTRAVEGSPYHSQISQHDLSGSVDYQTLSAGTQQQFAKHNNVHSAEKWVSPVPTQHIKRKYNPSKGSVHSQTASDVQQKTESIGLLKPKNFTPQSFAKTENQEKSGASHTKSSPYQTQTNNHIKPNKKDGTIASKYNSHSHTLNIGRSATLQVGTGTTQHEHYQAIGAPGNIQTGSAHPSHVKQSTYIASSGILQTGSAQPSHVQHSHHIAALATSQNDMLQHNDQLRQYTAASEITQKDPAQPSHAEHNLYMALLQAGSTQPSSFKENHHIAASGTIKTNMLQPSQTQKGVHITEVGTPQTNTALQSHIQQDHQIVGPERTLVGMAQHYAQPREHTAASETIQTNPVQPSHVPQIHDMVPLGTLKAGNGQTSSVRLSHYDAAPGTKEIGTLHIQHSMHNAAGTPLTDIALLSHMQQSHQIVGPGTIQAGMVQQNTQSSGTIQTDIAQPVHVPQKQHFIASRTSQAGMTHPRYDQPVVSGTTYSGSAQQSQAHESIKISKPGTLTDSMSQHKAQSGQNIKRQSKILQARNIQPSHIQQSQHSAAKGILHPGNKQPVALGTLQAGVTHSSNNHQSHNIAVPETSYSGPAQLSQGQQSHKITSQRTIQARMSQTNVQTNQYITPSGALQAGNTKPGHVQQSQHNVARGTIHPGNTQPSYVQEIQHILSTGTLQPGQTQPNQIKRSSQISGSVISQPDLSSQSQQSYYKVDTGNFQAVSSQLGGIQQSQHVAALETSHAAQPNHFKTISRSSTSGTSQPGYAQSQHKTPSATFQSVSAQLNYALPHKNVAASGNLNAYLAQPSTISQHSPASWSQNAGSTQHAQQEQRNQLTGTNHDAGIQKIYNMPDTLKAPKHGIPASWSQSSEGIGSQYFQLPNNTQRKNLIFHRQQEQRGAPGKSTNKHSSAVNMIHYAQPNDANNNQQSIYGTNQNNFVSQLPDKGAVSIQHSNLYPTDQYNAHGLQRNTTSSVSPMNVDQHNLRRTRGNQQTSIPGKLSQESQPYRQQSTAQDVFISRQLNTSLSNINQHSSSGSLNLAHDLMQHFKKDRQNSMHLAQDPQYLSHFSGHSDVSSQSQTHSNQEPGKHKLHHDRQVNNHKLDASKGQGTPQNDPFLNQQPAAKQLSGPYHSQQHIHQQFDSQNVGPSTVNRLGEMAAYQNKQDQFNLESGANQLDLYQSKTHLDREFHGQQLQQHGQVNPYAAAAFKIHGTGKNDHYSNEQPAAKRSKMQSSGPHQNQQQIHQQFDRQNYGSSAAHRAGIEALYHNTQGQSNLGSGLRQQDFYPSNIHSNREHSVQHLQGLSLNGKANGHTGNTSKVGGTRQNDPYLNKQLTAKRSKIQSSEPFQSQYQTGLQFNHEKIGQSGIHRADQEAAYHNTKGQYNPWSGPSQQHLYQSKTHSNREHSGQNLQELPQNGQVNSHATEGSKIHGTRQNNQNLNQQSAFPRKGVQSPESYQSQQQNNQRLKHQNFGQSGVQRAGQEAVHHNTEVHYNSRSASSQQNLYKSQQPENITGAVGLQSNHQVSLASQIISDYRSGQSQDFAGQPFKQITGLPRASSKLLAPYPLHQSDQIKGSKGTHYTEQASIQPHLHNKSKIERLTTKLPNEVHNQYPTNLAPQNLNDARGIHPKGHFVSQQNLNAKYQAEKVITNLSKTQVVQNAPYNSHDQAGSRTQNNEPFYMQEVIKGQIQFEKLTTLLPEPKHSKGSPYLSTVDIHGLRGVAGQEQISGQNVAQFAPIVESARLTKGQQGVVHPESNTNTHHDPQNTYISSKETQMEQNIGNFGKQKGKLANKNSSSHSEGSKNITGQSGTLKPGLKKASVNLIDKSQPQISKRDKSVKTARQTRLPDIKQYVTKTSRAPKYDALASKTLVLGPDKSNPIQEGMLRPKINYPHSSDAQTSKSPSATRKRQKTETNVLNQLQVKRQSKHLSVEHIPNVSGADIAQPGVIGKQSHSHGSEVFIPRTKNSFNTQMPNTTPVYVDTEVLFELNESRRMKGLPPLKKEQVDINGNILPGKPSPNIPLETAHAPTSNQHQAKGHGNPPANQIRANGDLNARLDALISLLYVQRFTHEAPPKFVITKSVINTTKDPYADLKKTDPEAYLEIMESKVSMSQHSSKATSPHKQSHKQCINLPQSLEECFLQSKYRYKPRRSMMLRVAFIGFGWMNPSHSCAKMPNDLCIIKLVVKTRDCKGKGQTPNKEKMCM